MVYCSDLLSLGRFGLWPDSLDGWRHGCVDIFHDLVIHSSNVDVWTRTELIASFTGVNSLSWSSLAIGVYNCPLFQVAH